MADDEELPDTRPIALAQAWGLSAKAWRDERDRTERLRPNHPRVDFPARRPNGDGEHVDMPAPPDRAPPIGEPIKAKLFPIERWKDISFDLNEEWLIDGVMPKRGVGVIFGASQSFKSFLAMHLSLCAARKLSWASRPVEFAPVVYIGAEGAAGLRKRKAGYEAIWQRDAAKVGAEPPTDIEFALIATAPNLGTTDGDLPVLIATIDSIGASPGLVVIDTAAKVMSGADENNQGAAALLCNGEALARHYGCFVLLIHHTGWGDDAQKRTRGWSGLPFGLDLIMLCERKQGDLSATVTIQKLKDDESRERFLAKLERVELGKTKTGRQVSTLVVDSVTQIENAPAIATGVKDRPPTQKKLLKDTIVEAIAEEGETLFTINPNIRGVDADIVRDRYDAAIAEPDKDADPQKAALRRTQAYNRSLKVLLDAKILKARKIRGRRMLWFA